jgi:uncharacterized protein GlcG (DUF336 family)
MSDSREIRTALNAKWPLLLTAIVLAGCGGGGSGSPEVVAEQPNTRSLSCNGSCASPTTLLRITDVEDVIAKAVAEAQAQGMQATIAVVDRVGNVLAVYQMAGALPFVTITSAQDASQKGADGGLEGVPVPSTLAAIAKAVTGAYLSSEGNAFTTRTASQIVQDHFNPGEFKQPSGPLFGVQFSQLPCSDLVTRFDSASPAPGIGPHRSPLGLSADPGGLPLYRNGTPVGGVGIIADDRYTIDPSVIDFDNDVDEFIAIAATFGRAAPVDRRGDRITVIGKLLRFSDATTGRLQSDPDAAPSFDSLGPATGQLVPVTGYATATIRRGTAFGTPASGISAAQNLFPGLDAFVLVDANNVNRYPPADGTDGPDALTAEEVERILAAALDIANRARAQIRRPLGDPARVTISVVDTNGVILGIVRGRDAPIFGIDVSLQKARTASFFSSAVAAESLEGVPPAAYIEIGPNQNGDLELSVLRLIDIGDYVTAAQDFLGLPSALTDGAIAFSDRAGGNLSRPFFPDGLDGTDNGPFSKPPGEWSPFSDGLQLDLVYNALIQHVAHAGDLDDFIVNIPDPVPDVGTDCTGVGPGFPVSNPIPELANGLQIFPGSVPIYRGSTLVGGIGISGDGVDQDDMIAFLGLHDAGVELGTVNNAPREMRADTVTTKGSRLRYVNCPQAPFNGSQDQEVCNGK